MSERTTCTRREALRAAGALAAAGLGGGLPAPARAQGRRLQLAFWHTRRADHEKLLQEFCEEYNQSSTTAQVLPQYQGSHDDLVRKLRASILSRSLPALAVAYEPNVVEFMANGVVRPLDSLVNAPRIGLSAAELADIHPAYLAANRYPEFGNRLLSFPFTKSNLVLYYNHSLLRQSGFSRPPATWEEFDRQAAEVTRRSRQPAWAFDPDPSTLDGMILSEGGGLLDSARGRTLFDQPATRRVLERLGRMARARQLRLIAGNEQGQVFSAQRCAFVFSTSAFLANTEELVGGRFDWDVVLPPRAPGVRPVTVMYGPNVCLFRGSPEQEAEAWKFVRFFVSPGVTARWARGTGYLPVRRSAGRLPEMREFYRKSPRAARVYEMVGAAKTEPSAVGWQEVRKHLADAARAVISGGTPAAAAAVELKRKADLALQQSRR